MKAFIKHALTSLAAIKPTVLISTSHTPYHSNRILTSKLQSVNDNPTFLFHHND